MPMRIRPNVTALVTVVLLATGAAAWSATKGELKWWQKGIIYQVYPRSFKDNNGDGVGDLAGITSKLQYLKDLGISAVWLSPIYPSPQADFGYDISNFVDVDQNYGTIQDFDKLVEESHKLGLKVVLDLVPNHTSDEHPWFVASRDPSHKDHGKYKDYFMWHKGKVVKGKRQVPNNWLSVFRGSAWTFDEKRGLYYFHQFHKKQPDLDFRNPKVIEEMKKVIQFWMDHNVDGFRIDAAPFIYEDDQYRDEPKSDWRNDPDDHASLEHIRTQDFNETYKLMESWMEQVDPKKENEKVILIEAYVSLENTIKYYGTKERPGSTFPFNFYMITDLKQSSNATNFVKVINRWMDQMTGDRWPNWVIGNHDNKRVATRYGPELADALNMLQMTLPGTVMTYYGEELGMVDNFIKWEDTLDPQAIAAGKDGYLPKSRDPCRTPFQWDDTTSAGFSNTTKTWLPVNPNYWQLNAKQQESERSHLNIYRRMVEARKTQTLQKGNLKLKDEGQLLILERTLEKEPTFILVINFGTREANWNTTNLSEMVVYASSLNSGVKDGQKLPILNLKPKAAILLTDGPIPANSAPSTTSSSLNIMLIGIFTVTYTTNIFKN